MFLSMDIAGDCRPFPFPGQEPPDCDDLAPAMPGLYPSGHRVQGLEGVHWPLGLGHGGGELGRHHGEMFPEE